MTYGTHVRRFSTSDGCVITASDEGRVIFWPIRPFSTKGTLDMLRSPLGLQPTRGFIEKLNMVDTWTNAGMPGRPGYTALHVLAEASVDGTYWGDAAGELSRYEDVLNEWANSDAAYAPVRNAHGATPLEVAVHTGNHRFFNALLYKKCIMGQDSGCYDGSSGAPPPRGLVTVRDLSAMLDWSSSVEAAVQYLQLPMLLQQTPRTLHGCGSYNFIQHFDGRTGLFETCASDYGAGAPKYLWKVYRQLHDIDFHEKVGSNTNDELVKLYSRQASGLKVAAFCTCCRRVRKCWTKVSNTSRVLATESYFVDVEGLSGATYGREVLRKLVIGGKRTEAAFAGPALQSIVACVSC